MVSIKDLKSGQQAIVESLEDTPLKNRLVSLGIYPNARIKLLRKSILQDTYYIQLDNIRLAIRKDLAGSILVKI